MKEKIWNRLSSLQTLRQRELSYRVANPNRIHLLANPMNIHPTDTVQNMLQALVRLTREILADKQGVVEYDKYFDEFRRSEPELYTQIIALAK